MADRAMVASAEGSRSASGVGPARSEKRAPNQKYNGGWTKYGTLLRCMTTQSCVRRISLATSPYPVSLLSQSVPTPKPGRVMSAATTAPTAAARTAPSAVRFMTKGGFWLRGAEVFYVSMLTISLRPNGRRAGVIGGGIVAARKAESLAEAGFRISVVADRIGDRLRDFLGANSGTCTQRRYEPGDLDGAELVVAATDDDEVNARVVADARAARILVCDASSPDRGDFTMPATFRVGDLTISADSAGGSPAFSKRIVRELSAQFGPEYGDALLALRRMRAHVKEAFPREEGA